MLRSMHPRAFAWPALLLIGTGLPNTASAADSQLVANLAPQIASRCSNGLINARALGEAIFPHALPDLKAEYVLVSGPRLFAARAFNDMPGPNRDAYTLLRRLAETWVDPSDPSANDYLPAAAGGIVILERDGSPVLRARAQEVLAAILAGDDTQFAFQCSDAARPADPDPQPDPTPSPNRTIISIAKSPDDLGLPIKKKAFAEISFLRDEVADEDSYSIYATLGLTWGEFTPITRKPGRGVLLRAIPSAFVQLEREGIGDGAAIDEVDNLNFGAQLAGFIQTRGGSSLTHYYSVTGRLLSDGNLESEAWAATLSITPEIPIPGNDQAYDLVTDRLQFSWLVSGVADYFDVVDAGDKSQLQSLPEFTRVGFDSSASIRFLLGKGRSNALSLSGEYRLREALGSNLGDANMLSLKLMFEPTQSLAFGVGYDRGRNLDSLEFIETWKVTLGIRK